MKQTLLPRALLALPIAVLAAACTTQGNANDHWTQRSISNSMTRAFLGYDELRDGSYLDHQYANKKDVRLIGRRYFFHHNPENPFQVYDESYYEPRYPNSPVPDTVTYLQDPIASIFGTFSEGGAEEFSQGFTMTASGERPESYQGQKSASYMRSSVGVGNYED